MFLSKPSLFLDHSPAKASTRMQMEAPASLSCWTSLPWRLCRWGMAHRLQMTPGPILATPAAPGMRQVDANLFRIDAALLRVISQLTTHRCSETGFRWNNIASRCNVIPSRFGPVLSRFQAISSRFRLIRPSFAQNETFSENSPSHFAHTQLHNHIH